MGALSALIVPPTVFSGQKFDVRWTVENTGDGPTYNSAWDDAIYLTRDSVLVPDRALAKVFYRRILNIKPDRSYTYTYPMALPDSVAGGTVIDGSGAPGRVGARRDALAPP
mgnify:CR=1 FL=1